jgi:hypothetical protein
MQLASEAFTNISGVIHRLLLDPAARIFKWLWTKVSMVSPPESSMQPGRLQVEELQRLTDVQ